MSYRQKIKYEMPEIELGLEDLYPAGYFLRLISGAHGQFFNERAEPNVVDLTDKLKMGIALAVKDQSEV